MADLKQHSSDCCAELSGSLDLVLWRLSHDTDEPGYTIQIYPELTGLLGAQRLRSAVNHRNGRTTASHSKDVTHGTDGSP